MESSVRYIALSLCARLLVRFAVAVCVRVCEVSCVGGCDLQATSVHILELLYFHLCVGKANADLRWEELASVK